MGRNKGSYGHRDILYYVSWMSICMIFVTIPSLIQKFTKFLRDFQLKDYLLTSWKWCHFVSFWATGMLFTSKLGRILRGIECNTLLWCIDEILSLCPYAGPMCTEFQQHWWSTFRDICLFFWLISTYSTLNPISIEVSDSVAPMGVGS